MNIFKKLKPVDYIIIGCVILLLILGTLAVVKKQNFSSLPVEKETVIQFDVFLRGITISDNIEPFGENLEAFITIRNVPYTKLKIVNYSGQPRMKTISTNTKPFVASVPDAATPNLFDFIITLEDKAKKTGDGYVIGGNKLKMGVPIVLENDKYRYSGTVSRITDIEELQKQLQEQQAQPKTDRK